MIRRFACLAGLLLMLSACAGPPVLQIQPGDSALIPPATATATTVPETPIPAPPPPAPSPTPEPTPEPTPTPSPTVTPLPSGIGGPQRDLRWETAIATDDGGKIGVVLVDGLNIRSAPRLDAPIVDVTYARHTITVYDHVTGDVVENNPVWYRVGTDRYVAAAMVEPLTLPAPPTTFEGHWVDINLSTFYAVGYDGATPRYAALIIAGIDDLTPVGTFEILRRVRSDTMDAATLGVPEDHPDYYYLPNVEYVQYFKEGGYALHGSYWNDPASFGSFASHGCINLLNADAAWFWDFLDHGSVVNIHY